MNRTHTFVNAVIAHADEAVALAQNTAGYKLDFSEDSIKFIEEILGRMHTEIREGKANPPTEVIERVCSVYGAYIGEVMRRIIGGEWILDDKVLSGTKILALKCGTMQTSPCAKVYKRILNGPEDDVWFYYKIFVEQSKDNMKSNS